ncbi:MAG: hypothetical protein KAG84_06070 [Bacteroidales bacterium]|nr:hypothetical protein [Bacteroidales bacterium]
MRKLHILYFILITIILSSCATVLGGKRNTISTKNSNPPQAKIYLHNKEIGQGDFKIKVSKYDLQEGDLLLIKSDGYITDTLIVERKINNWYAASDFITTLGLSLLIDVGTGNIYRPNTQNIEINLKKEGNSE